MNTKLLGIYLNDHLAGSRGWLELARRAERENRGSPVGGFLASFIQEVEEDRESLERVMRALGISRDFLKEGVAFVAERVGRLKLNGRLLRYSPLSRLVELESLCASVQGKQALWRALRRLSRTEFRLQDFDFDVLLARAESQLKGLERLRVQAADTAFAEKTVPLRPTPAQVVRG